MGNTIQEDKIIDGKQCYHNGYIHTFDGSKIPYFTQREKMPGYIFDNQGNVVYIDLPLDLYPNQLTNLDSVDEDIRFCVEIFFNKWLESKQNNNSTSDYAVNIIKEGVKTLSAKEGSCRHKNKPKFRKNEKCTEKKISEYGLTHSNLFGRDDKLFADSLTDDNEYLGQIDACFNGNDFGLKICKNGNGLKCRYALVMASNVSSSLYRVPFHIVLVYFTMNYNPDWSYVSNPNSDKPDDIDHKITPTITFTNICLSMSVKSNADGKLCLD